MLCLPEIRFVGIMGGGPATAISWGWVCVGAERQTLPELMMFQDGKTTPISVGCVEWQDSFVDCTCLLPDLLRFGGELVLAGTTSKAVRPGEVS